MVAYLQIQDMVADKKQLGCYYHYTNSAFFASLTYSYEQSLQLVDVLCMLPTIRERKKSPEKDVAEN